MVTSCNGLRVLLVGSFPPPYGGIASHLTMLIPGLILRGAGDVCVLSNASGEDSVERINDATILRFNVKRHVHRLLAPKYWPVIIAALREYATMNLGVRRMLIAMTQALLVDEVARRYTAMS